jgi:hypothetical protein
MVKRLLFAGPVLALWAVLAAAGPAAAQATERGAAAKAGFRAKQVLGSKVTIQGNASIGTVDDIVIDADGQVEYLVVLNEGKLVTVPWDAAKFDFERRAATLTITQDQYRAIPTYTVERYPDFYAPAYRTEIYKAYGLTPRQQRKLNREP